MKLVHNIIISAFAKQDEDATAILDCIKSTIPLDLEKEKIKPKKTIAEGITGGKIAIFEVQLEKERQTGKYIEQLKEKLSEKDLEQLATQENRVDDDCTFYLRLDKQKLLSGKYALTDGGDCFHIKMSIAAFPKKREVAIEAVKKMFA